MTYLSVTPKIIKVIYHKRFNIPNTHSLQRQVHDLTDKKVSEFQKKKTVLIFYFQLELTAKQHGSSHTH